MSDDHAEPCLLVGCVPCLLGIQILIDLSEIEDDGYENLPQWNHCHEYVDHNDLSLVDVSEFRKGVVNIFQAFDGFNDLCQVASLVDSRITCIVL